MDTDRFDALSRSLVAAPSRRSVVSLALGGTFGSLLGQADTEAKKRHKKKACPTCATCAEPTICPTLPLTPFCAGKNHCVAPSPCQGSGASTLCYCWLRADAGHIGEPFCGEAPAGPETSCGPCTGGGKVCVLLGGECKDGSYACSLPCSNFL